MDTATRTITIVTLDNRELTFHFPSTITLPQIGETVDVTSTTTPVPGTIVEVSNLNLSKTNVNRVTGFVTAVNTTAGTITIVTLDNRELTFHFPATVTLPQIGETVDVTSTTTPVPGTIVEGSNLNLSKTNVNRVTGIVTAVNTAAGTFTIVTANNREFTFYIPNTMTPPVMGDTVDVIFTPPSLPGTPAKAINLNLSKSNVDKGVTTTAPTLTGAGTLAEAPGTIPPLTKTTTSLPNL